MIRDNDTDLLHLFHLLQAKEPVLLRKLLSSCAALVLKDDDAVAPSCQPGKERFLVKTGRCLTSVPVNQVAYFYCEDKTIYLKTKDDKSHILRSSMEELAQTISAHDFFRINRQIIVSRHSIKKMMIWFNGTLRVDLMPGDHCNIIISKLKAPLFKQWMGE
jgi:DNA-binding LytR/AlgR family response regulator